MNCDELTSSLPLLALGELDRSVEDAAREHLNSCERCRSRLGELRRTRSTLDLVEIGEAAPLDGATIRARAKMTVAPASGWGRAAAAAALLLLALGAGFGGGRLARAAPAGEDAADAVPPAVLAQALVALDERLATLEARHDRDLLALAQAVDRQQSRRDEGVAQQLDQLARSSRAQFLITRDALDDVARLVQPALHVVPDHE
jgi:hypothetical protein